MDSPHDIIGLVPRARTAVSILFLVHGLTVASWVARIPAIRNKLELSPAELGTVLLALAVGSLLSMPVTGWAVHHHGSRLVTSATTVAFCLALPLISLAPDKWLLGAALAVFGAAAGAMDVSMNAQAVELETEYGRPIMSSFHALFSIGGMAGAALGGAVAAAGIEPRMHFAASALAFGTLAAFAFPALHRAPIAGENAHFSFRLTPQLAALGLLGFCVLVGEGAMADWTAVYLQDVAGTGQGLAAIGYAVFSGTMAAGRLCGDWLTARVGRARLVRCGTLLASMGLAVALLLGGTAPALVGFGCVGAGFSVIVPLVFTASGRVPGVAASAGIAAVTSASYFGFLAGPPLIGFTAEYTNLRIGLGLVVILSAIACSLAKAVDP
jgi:MFS family permease